MFEGLGNVLPILKDLGRSERLSLWNYTKPEFSILIRIIKIEKGKIIFLIEFDGHNFLCFCGQKNKDTDQTTNFLILIFLMS
jgi:hypothetical protein